MKHILIIGGGISGLSAAYHAQKHSGNTQITLLEACDRWGGKIVTERIAFNGSQFIIEGGPDTFLATKPYAVALCKELDLSERLHGTNPHQKSTYVLHRNRLQPLPDGLAMMIPTNVQAILKTGLVSWFGKVRMGLDFLLPPYAPNGDESLGAFVSRRLGREAYENLIEPLMSGIYAGDGDQLSLASTFPYLRDLELKYGSLARGALEMRKKSPSTPGTRSAFLTLTTGLAEIVEALVARLENIDLHLKTAATRIIQNGSKFHVEIENSSPLEADYVILATPAYISASLLSSLDESLSADLKSVPYVSTATISLAYQQQVLPRPLDGYGYVIPRREERRVLACTWTSTKFPHRAPHGYALLRVFVGRAGQEFSWSESDLIALAREELALTLGIRVEPILTRVFMWDKAMPQYNLGHPDLLRRIDTALGRHPGLALAGNGYRGIGIPDCIHSGELAVQNIFQNTREMSGTPATPTSL